MAELNLLLDPGFEPSLLASNSLRAMHSFSRTNKNMLWCVAARACTHCATPCPGWLPSVASCTLARIRGRQRQETHQPPAPPSKIEPILQGAAAGQQRAGPAWREASGGACALESECLQGGGGDTGAFSAGSAMGGAVEQVGGARMGVPCILGLWPGCVWLSYGDLQYVATRKKIEHK